MPPKTVDRLPVGHLETVPSPISEELVVECLDGGKVPGPWASRRVREDFYRHGGKVTFTLELPTRHADIDAVRIRDGELELARKTFRVVPMIWNEARPAVPEKGWKAHPAGGDSFVFSWGGLAP